MLESPIFTSYSWASSCFGFHQRSCILEFSLCWIRGELLLPAPLLPEEDRHCTSEFGGQAGGRTKDNIEGELVHESKNLQAYDAKKFLAQSNWDGDKSIKIKKAAQLVGMSITWAACPDREKCLAQSL